MTREIDLHEVRLLETIRDIAIEAWDYFWNPAHAGVTQNVLISIGLIATFFLWLTGALGWLWRRIAKEKAGRPAEVPESVYTIEQHQAVLKEREAAVRSDVERAHAAEKRRNWSSGNSRRFAGSLRISRALTVTG